ncbi:MAG: UvrB/UvrC motif-containing protein, partial [Lachnospiraceae bacterium]|nr:UvrB/UvrC motif-containing protein [Lachnospiraceae bacterium]
AVRDLISITKKVDPDEVKWKKDPESMSAKELRELIAQTESAMRKAAADLDFEKAAMLRDELFELKSMK